MALTKAKKDEIVKKYARTKGDTGSPEVQIAILTEEIKELTAHLQEHPHIIQEEDFLKKLVKDVAYKIIYSKKMLLVIEN